MNEIETIYFKDTEYPFTEHNHTRKVVRAFVFNDENKVGVIHIKRKDNFGEFEYYETTGGGVKEGEDFVSAIKREIKEEMGFEVCDIQPILRIVDEYNLIQRINDQTYYVCKISGRCDMHREKYETEWFKDVPFFTIDEVIEIYSKMSKEKGLVRLVGIRELTAIEKVKELLRKWEKLWQELNVIVETMF